MIRASMSGGRQMAANILKAAAVFPNRVEAALYQEAQIEVTEMKRRTPVDTTPNAPHPGNLRASLHSEEPQRSGRRIWIVIATGAQAPYDIYVHENPDAHHPIGQWKFMESVINESAPFMAQRIAMRVNLNSLVA